MEGGRGGEKEEEEKGGRGRERERERERGERRRKEGKREDVGELFQQEVAILDLNRLEITARR